MQQVTNHSMAQHDSQTPIIGHSSAIFTIFWNCVVTCGSQCWLIDCAHDFIKFLKKLIFVLWSMAMWRHARYTCSCRITSHCVYGKHDKIQLVARYNLLHGLSVTWPVPALHDTKSISIILFSASPNRETVFIRDGSLGSRKT